MIKPTNLFFLFKISVPEVKNHFPIPTSQKNKNKKAKVQILLKHSQDNPHVLNVC